LVGDFAAVDGDLAAGFDCDDFDPEDVEPDDFDSDDFDSADLVPADSDCDPVDPAPDSEDFSRGRESLR
jgi:hypothetical protein